MKFFGRRALSAQSLKETPEESAARWLARTQLGLTRRDEDEEFQHWRAEPENAKALDRLNAILDQVQETASQPGISQIRAEALARPRRSPLLLGNVPVGVAAAVLVAVLGVLFVWRESGMRNAFSDSAEVSANNSPKVTGDMAIESYETRKGERRTIKLADGSSLVLNTASRAEVAMTAEKRTVRLVRGQALFQIAKDKERPFNVIAGSIDVTALGTQFDVRLDRERTKVVLVEGRVRIEPLARRGIAQLLPMIDRHYLNPGEQLTAKDDDLISVTTADIERTTSWQYDRLVFRDNTLGEAIAEFNRYSSRQIMIPDSAVAQFPVSGVFSISRPENFLAAVSTFYSLQLEERSPRLAVLGLRKR